MAKKRVRKVSNSGSSSMHYSPIRPYAFGHAGGIIGVITFLFYAILAWFGSYVGDVFIEKFPIGFSFHDWTIFIGLIQAYAFVHIFGQIFARVYNSYLRR